VRTLHKIFGKSMLASICIVGALIIALLPAAVVGAGSSDSGFHISQWTGETWEEIYQHQFQVQYSTEAFTVDVVDGKVALRIVQVGTPFADIDQISLMVDGEELTPEYAWYTESGQSIVEDILELDHNVVIAHEQEIEVSWDVPAGYGSVTVYLTANEYGHGLPFRFPEIGYATYEVGSNMGSIAVDGLIPETDGTVPLYCPYWQPSSGHPDGYTYIYVCDDEQYVYFSLDVTIDNTNEYGEDWAEIRILQSDGSEQVFRIDDFDNTWGESGFGLTSKVTYKHQTCEFAIPKSMIDDNNIKFSLAYYGTASINGDVHADADVDPLVIEINGDSSSGQVFSVGDTINVEGYVHSVANASVNDGGEYVLETTLSCDLWLNPGNLEHDWHYEANNVTSSNYTIGNEYNDSLSFIHTLTTPGVYSITLNSIASASISYSGSGSKIMGSYDSAQETLSFTVTGGRLFMVDGGNSTIYELDPSTGTVLNTIPTPTATDGGGDGLAYGNGRMFFTTIDTNDIYEINPSSGAILNQFTGPVTWEGIDALGFSGDKLYALGYGDNATIHVLHPDSGANITTLEPGIPLIGGLTFAGTRDSLFVSNSGGEPSPSFNMTNQGFEAGNFTGWNVYTGSGGNASVETSWESSNGTVYYPEMGAYFALLENGALNESTYISQNFTIDAGEIIEGRAFFSTEENYADEPYIDECSVDVMDGTTLVDRVFYANTTDANWPDTPWIDWSWEAISTGTYTLVARVVNIGDGDVPSYMGLDIAEEEPNTIYEIDDETGAVLNSFPAPVGSGYGLYGLGFSSSRNTLFLGFWEPDIAPDIVYEVDPDDGTVINSFVGPAGTAISALAADEFVAVAGPIVNGSFETGDYTGWTLLEFSAYGGHAADCGTWGIASDGQTISCNDSAWDFFDEILVEQCPVSSITYHASDGEYLAYQLQNCEETHRMYQDITLNPCATTLYWDMWYTNWAGEFDSGNQSLAVHIRDVSDDSIKATLFQTTNGTSPVAINMTPFSADVSAFAGQTVRLDVTLNTYWGPLDAAFDNFRIRSNVDQSNDGTSNWYTIYGYRPTGQEFVPSESNLEGVEVYIRGSDMFDGYAELTVNIRSGNITGPIVASKTQILHETKPDHSTAGWVYFQFDAPSSVSIGNLYVLELSTNRTGHMWFSSGTNSYADGSAIRSGIIHTGTDYAFRTTYGCTEEPCLPVVASVTETAFDTNTLTHNVSMPTAVDAGDLLIVLFTNDGYGVNATTPVGWNLLDSRPANGCTLSAYYRVATGIEGGTGVDITTSNSEEAVAQVYRITNWHGTTPPEISTDAVGLTTSPDPYGLNPSGWDLENTLWIAVAGQEFGGGSPTYPTDYVDGISTISSNHTTRCGMHSAIRINTVSSENPGPFGIGDSAQWVAYTIAVRPPVCGGGDTPPVANNNTVGTSEDTQLTFAACNFPYSDVDGDSRTAVKIVSLPSHGTLNYSGSIFTTPYIIDEADISNLTFEPAANEYGSPYTTFDFQVQAGGAWSANTANMTINVSPVNDAPIAVADCSYTTNEDTTLIVGFGSGLLSNDLDIDGPSLTVHNFTLPSHGTLSMDPSADGSFNYTPYSGYYGTDGFTYRATDGSAESNWADVCILIYSANDCPVIDYVSPASQTVQFSDPIDPITVVASDADGDSLTLVDVPYGLNAVEGPTNTWVISGQFMDDHAMDWIIGVTDGECETPAATITSLEECVVVRFDNHNPMSVEIDDAQTRLDSDAEFTVHIKQDPDGYLGWADLAANDTAMRIVPVGGGAPITMSPAGHSDLAVFSDGAPVSFTFNPPDDDLFHIGTYVIEVTVNNDYYKVCGGAESLLMVYDPDVGASGSGTFEDDGDTYSFAFLVDYNKKGKNLRGSLVIIRELSGGGIYRIQSNALYDLALIEDSAVDVASFSGKCTYIGPDVLDDYGDPQNVGGQEFVVYLEDYDTSSGLSGTPDRFWFTVLGRDFTLDFNSNNRADSGEIMQIDGDIIIPDRPANVGRGKH